ncbi:hypothetical protein HC723_11030 [Vibrio sp. S11_S32]|uniref:hypothetical protein n=1 Tax=Vibrio sp. S11_S32 TaxID=2720225 RepID=UPI0016804C9B|nr:hypothetical protein [Vibrio sp. S11_S32]MBD1576962.1 hypothetical protein [Vibrio sp. S11_S32]
MELQSITAKVDALREKGFSDDDINQLLGVDEKAAPTQSVDANPEAIIAALKGGNVQVLQQFAKGHDPEIFNAKVDEIVDFLECSVKEQIKNRSIIWGSVIAVIIFINIGDVFSIEQSGIIFGISILTCIIANAAISVSSLKRQYNFLKPRVLFFIRK